MDARLLVSHSAMRTIPIEMDDRVKNRLRLWLRGEHALGNDSLRIPAGWKPADAQAPRPSPTNAGHAGTTQRPSATSPMQPPHRTTPVAATAPVSPTQPPLQPRMQPPRQPAPHPVPASPTVSQYSLNIPIIGQYELQPPSTDPFTSPIMTTQEKQAVLERLNRDEVSICQKCRLCKSRTHTVFGEGNVDARLVFIGEGPGKNEDLQGRPFVGRAGQQLDKMVAAMGLRRSDIYITNIVKCRPPDNRVPAPDEVAACTPYLERQLEVIRPQVIVSLGLSATQYLLGTKNSISSLRGRWHTWRGIKLMPTYHPAYVLRNYTTQVRGAVWADLQQVMAELELPLPH